MSRTEQEIIKDLCGKRYKVIFNDERQFRLERSYLYDRTFYDEGSVDKYLCIISNKECKRFEKIKTIENDYEFTTETSLIPFTKREKKLLDELAKCWGWK